MSAVTHVTEWGLGLCSGLATREEWSAHGSDPAWRRAEARLSAAGLRAGVVACGTEFIYSLCVLSVLDEVPTCPRCAVLRDEALEGRLPVREAKP